MDVYSLRIKDGGDHEEPPAFIACVLLRRAYLALPQFDLTAVASSRLPFEHHGPLTRADLEIEPEAVVSGRPGEGLSAIAGHQLVSSIPTE
ncbi:hypothetical protein AQJ64_03815 [Streptomyces griseoruber]|uniref:Uncharacterized protein n=1 Tax=Streptomyces griseoruber TaxID=1943 RepID=A0A124I4X0_9ACTN|nr:hypothetical protein AQJ64_03815 [Streptomyces griseoruber]